MFDNLFFPFFQVFIHSSDTDGRALLGRFQTKTQDLQSDDQEVKVQVYII
jgi:ionotropic glutamate receptor NMDA 1